MTFLLTPHLYLSVMIKMTVFAYMVYRFMKGYFVRPLNHHIILSVILILQACT